MRVFRDYKSKKRSLQIINMQQQCLDETEGVINESGDASLDYFSSKKNVVRATSRVL